METLTHICHPPCVNSLRPKDAIHRLGFCLALVQIMACCLAAPSHYLNLYVELVIFILTNFSEILIKIQWFSSEQRNFKMSSARHQPFYSGLNRFIYVSLRPGDAIRHYQSGSILDQVMSWCLTAPSHT